MNLLLRPLDNPDDPVWSVIILVIIAVGLALGYVVYILGEAFEELKDAEPDRTQGRTTGSGDSTPETQS
jgi:hypothetical protein